MTKQKLNFLPQKLVLWVTFTIIITAFSGLVYAAVQQNFRQNANDPQIQMAEDSATALNAGEKVTPAGSVDVASSLGSFIIIYNEQKKVVASGARLHGTTPELPDGIFTKVKDDGEQRFTWQPEDDVRIAAVVVPYGSGYVLAGRSLREVEVREHKLTLQVGGVWSACILLVTILSFLL